MILKDFMKNRKLEKSTNPQMYIIYIKNIQTCTNMYLLWPVRGQSWQTPATLAENAEK